MTIIEDFKKFLQRGSVVDLAVGMVMGAAFTAIVNSFVEDIISPVIGMLMVVSLKNTFIVLRRNDCDISQSLNTLKQAQDCGATTMNWGLLLETTIRFFIVSVVMFIVVRIYARSFHTADPTIEPRSCKFCLQDVAQKATRCHHCTSHIEAGDSTKVQ